MALSLNPQQTPAPLQSLGDLFRRLFGRKHGVFHGLTFPERHLYYPRRYRCQRLLQGRGEHVGSRGVKPGHPLWFQWL